MTGETHTYPYVSPGPIKLPPGSLEPVEELPGDSEYEDEGSHGSLSDSDIPLSDGLEDGDEEQGSIRERDPVFEKIKESLSKTQRSDSVLSGISSVSDTSDGPHVQISENYTSVPYGIQPKATYEHSSMHGDIMGVAYNNRMRQFVILDSKGITTWKRDQVDPRVRRALQYPKYEYRLIVNIVYAPKYNCYFALGKDFSLKVLNRDFEETCSVSSDLRSVLFMLFNPVKDELITGGVGGIKFWEFKQKAGQAFQELKPLANYKLEFLYALPNVGGSWVKRVDLDHYLQHLYCCSDTDLHVYDLQGKLLFKFERAHTMSITGCCFSPFAKVLVTSSVDSEVKVWSLTGGLVHTFRGHSRAVTSLILHPETSSLIMTASLDGSFRIWSLDTMDQLYMLVVSTDGVLWMGLTDDKFLYISTCRNITLWNLNRFYRFWGLARNQVSKLSLASCEEKTTRVVAVGDDSSVRIFCRSNQRNITTVLPPPDISALQSVLSVCYSREKNVAFLLVTNKEIWVYTTRTDPACRIAVWDVHELQLPYISGDTSNLPPGVIIQPPSTSMGTHRATENGHGNEIVSSCRSLCILNSTAMMWTDEGLCCPIRHTYLLLGLEDGRILFMDPVIRGQKYMEFKACKDAIQDMRHDVPNGCLITQCRLKELVIIQIWALPTLDPMYELYAAPDITCYARLGLSFLSGHKSGHLNFHTLIPIEDPGTYSNAKQEPDPEEIIDISRRPEHASAIVAMDTSATLRIFCTCSYDGAIKVWDENKFLMTEVMLEESLSAACFLNDMGDLLVGFKNHIFYIDHSRLCPQIKPPQIEMETSDQESDVYEDPRVLYELLEQNPEPITKESYLVPYPNIEFDKDFLEGITKIDQHKAPIQSEEEGSESETDVSLAPSSIYVSPPESPHALSMIDLTLGSDYSKYDLKHQMKYTLEYIFKRELEERKWQKIPESRRYLELRRLQKASNGARDTSRKHSKFVTIDTPGQSDMEDKEADLEVENFSLPVFGDSPGPSPSVTPPTRPSSPRQINVRTKSVISAPDILVVSDEEKEEPAEESTFVPVEPEAVSSVSWNLESSTSEFGQLSRQSAPVTKKSLTKSDLGIKRASDSNIASHGHFKRDFKARRFSQPDLINRRPLKQSPVKIHATKKNVTLPNDKNETKMTDTLQNERKFKALKSVAETDTTQPSSKPLLNIRKMSLNNKSKITMPADKTDEVEFSTSDLTQDSTCAIKEIAFSEVDTLKVKSSSKSTEKVNDFKVSSVSETEMPETDNKSSLSDSGLGSDYSIRTMKTDSGSEYSTRVANTDNDPKMSVKEHLNTDGFKSPSGGNSMPVKLFETRSVSPSPDSSKTQTLMSRPETLSKGSKKSCSDIGIKKMALSQYRAPTPQQEKSTLGVYPEGESRRYGLKSKVDVKGLMKKRRVTSGRAPSLTRRASADHSHDDHDHDHGHDDNRVVRKQIQKKQQQQPHDRKLPPHLDRNKLLELPPNPPSMLTRKNSLSKDRKNLEIQLLHHPDYRRESKDSSHEHDLAHVKYNGGHIDLEQAQEEMWKAEASLHGTQLAIPPQRDPSRARLTDGPYKDPRSLRNRNRTPMFGEKDVVDTHVLGVGATPTAELEDDKEEEGKLEAGQKKFDKPKIQVPTAESSTGTEDQITKEPRGDADDPTNIDANTPETQMEREKRLGLKVNNELFQEGEDKKRVPKVLVQRSKLNIYLPQADRDSVSTKSSRRGTPDSGVDDNLSVSGGQTPTVQLVKHSVDQEKGADDQLQPELADKKDESLLSEDDKAKAVRRPASSFTGLRRGQLEGERLKAERPHTAHVRFKAEDLQAAFEEALERYQNLPGQTDGDGARTPKIVSADKLYKNDGTSFEDNWQERVIERHILLRMQREIRAQSAAQRREAYVSMQQDRRNKQSVRSCDSAVGLSQPESTVSTVRRATTSMSVPLRPGRTSVPPPSREKQRPKTAHPTLQKPAPSKSDLSQEKAFRYRLSQDPPFSARSNASTRSSAPSVQDFSPHWIDPRNPDAWRPKSSRSIPSKCQRYVLISKPRDATQAPIPSPLEEQLLVERFPKMGAKVLHTMPEPVPKVKKSYNMEYSPFVYQRFV